MKKVNKIFLQVNIYFLIFITNRRYRRKFVEQQTEKLDLSLIKDIKHLINENSIELEDIQNGINSDKDENIKICYLKNDEIPKIKIIDKHLMASDEKVYKIIDYLKQIKDYIKKLENNDDDKNDLLDDFKYDICGICKNNMNKFFCVICNKNICQKCYIKCEEENHNVLSLEGAKAINKINILTIAEIFKYYIIPIKE